MNASRIDRISELYRRSQSVELTEEEKEEQTRLRQEYVAAIRGSLCNSLNNISVEEPDGSVMDLGKKHGRIKEA